MTESTGLRGELTGLPLHAPNSRFWILFREAPRVDRGRLHAHGYTAHAWNDVLGHLRHTGRSFARVLMRMAADLTYARYLRLHGLLDQRASRSASHDEMLFIVIHQASELCLVARALTVETRAGDNLAIHVALGRAQPGDVPRRDRVA